MPVLRTPSGLPYDPVPTTPLGPVTPSTLNYAVTGPMPNAPNDYGYINDAMFGRGVPTGVNVPVGQTATTSQPGQANFWDFLRNLFSGQRTAAPTPQGMTGLLQPAGRSARGVDTLGNPFNRY